jgi:hypothetical protein
MKKLASLRGMPMRHASNVSKRGRESFAVSDAKQLESIFEIKKTNIITKPKKVAAIPIDSPPH